MAPPEPWWARRAPSLVLLWATAWVVLPLWVVREVPVDSAEQMTWVRSLQWGYHKHPPLPTWLIAPWVGLFGLQAWIPAVMGALMKVLSLLLCWDLMRRIGGRMRATLALVGITCVAYYSARLHTYSHNEVMLLCSAGAAWALWRAAQEGRLRYWLLLGLCLGLGLLAKYQAVTTVATVLVFAVLSGLWKHAAARRGLLGALLLAAVVASPHLAWLASAPHTPLNYAAQSTFGAGWGWGERIGVWLTWNGDLLGRCLGALLPLGAWAWWSRPRGAVTNDVLGSHEALTEVARRSASVEQGIAQNGRLLLWCWAMVPVSFVWAMSLLAGAAIRPHWATPIAIWLIAAISLLLPPQALSGGRLQRFMALAAAVQLGLVAQLLWAEHRNAVAPARWGQPMVQRWAEEVAEAARRELGGDIRVVIAPETVASTFALAVPDRPYAVLDGRLEISPWVPPGLIERCGVLFIVYEPPAPGSRTVQGGPADMIWRVVPPLDGHGCSGDQKKP
jgi:4-amino-4-deoxy-L-arabinose transferase-like glycosyltransferase